MTLHIFLCDSFFCRFWEPAIASPYELTRKCPECGRTMQFRTILVSQL